MARERIVPRLEQHPGFAGLMIIVERARGVTIGITFWNTEDDLAASEEIERRLIGPVAQGFEASTDVRNCEVAFSTFG
jgi:hypothetical protein